MLNILDRQLMVSYGKAFLVCLVSLLAMYAVVDLFMNLDEFSHNSKGMSQFLERIGKYYGWKIVEIFDRLCEPVVLLSAMFTIAWMQRNNEILPLLSAGVSTRRVVRPVLFASALMLGAGIVNQEVLLPRIDTFFLEHRSQDKEVKVKGAYDVNGVHISGNTAVKSEMLIKEFVCTIPATVGRPFVSLQAKEAQYVPPGSTPGRSGGWRLTGTSYTELPAKTELLEMIAPGTLFLRTDIDFDAVTRARSWFNYVDTLTLVEELEKGGSSTTRLASIATVFHMRVTRPILGLLLVFMGLSIILQNHQRNIYISAGLCLFLCLVFFASRFFCHWLGTEEYLIPAVAAWIPVFVFGPLSFVMFDAVHT